MDIVSRARGIILQPRAEWPIIDAEPSSVGALYSTYLVPLALLAAIARLVASTVIGFPVPFIGRLRAPFVWGLESSLVTFVAMLVGVYLWALIINALAPTFGGRKDMPSALKLAVYSATPALLASVLSLLPVFGIVQLLQIVAACYGLYVLYLGFPVLMKVARERAAGYTAATVVSGIVLGIACGVVISMLGFGMGGFGASRATAAADEQMGQNALAGVLGAAGGGTAESRNAAAALVAGAVAAGQRAEAAERAGTAGAGGTTVSASGGDAVDAQTAAGAGAAAAAMLGSMVSGGKAAVAVVPFQTLEAALPTEVGALRRTNASGEKSNVAGVSGSSATGSYEGANGGSLTIKLSDMGNASGVMALGRMAFSVESESDGGYEKNVSLAGQKVHEKWTSSGSRSELAAFVGDRFMVEVTGSGVDVGTAEKAFSSIDFGKLSAQ